MGEIYRLYAKRIFGLRRYMLDSRERAEDGTSEVFLKLQLTLFERRGGETDPLPGIALPYDPIENPGPSLQLLTIAIPRRGFPFSRRRASSGFCPRRLSSVQPR